MRRKKPLLAALAAMLALCLTGCPALSVDEMYSLPRQSDSYNALQNAINEILVNGLQYASPVSGSNQQPIQMADLTGDGIDEAIVFTKTDGVKPLRVQIFGKSRDSYTWLCSMDGDGSAFDRVEYAQIDGEPGLEIVVGRSLGNQGLQTISAYRLEQDQPTELMSANYTEFCMTDLDGNETRDLFVIRYDAENRNGIAELYRYENSEMQRSTETAMSAGADAVRRITTGNLKEGLPAVFVSSVTEDAQIVTDIFTLQNGTLNVLSSDKDLSFTNCPVRGYNVYADDLDGDGFVEIPNVMLLNSYSEETADDQFFAIEWFSCTAERNATQKLTTYHNYSGGWYLTLPEKLGVRFIVWRGDTVSGARGLDFFSERENGTPGDLLFTIYAFSGDNRSLLAEEDGRFPLAEKNEVIYCALLGETAENFEITRESLSSAFHFIQVNWNSGET